MRAPRLRDVTTLGTLSLAALVLALFVGEFAIRWLLPAPTRYRVYPPNLRAVFEPRSEIMPGVSGTSRFLVNSQGMRADEPSGQETRRILAVGGSTTQCLYLDQDEAWPRRLERLLNERFAPRQRVWVGNVGKAGRYSSEHVLQVRHLLAQHEPIDLVILLLGANDVFRRLAIDGRYEPLDPDRSEDQDVLLPRAFEEYPQRFSLIPPRRTATWSLAERVVRQLRSRANWRQIEDEAGRNYEVWRLHRTRASRLRQELPDLAEALAEYRRNLALLAGLARENSAGIVFMTQPTIYRPDLSDRERRLLWMGRVGEFGQIGDEEYYSVEALARAFATYNAALLRFCREAKVECIDLAAVLPKDTRSFYDDLHFNEAGAERVARVLAEYLGARPPFSDEGES